MREQPGWAAHAEFMDRLAAEGFVVAGGPLSGSDRSRVRALLVVRAPCDDAVRRRLEEDPWTSAELLELARLEPWELLLGAERLAGCSDAGARAHPAPVAVPGRDRGPCTLSLP